MEQMYITDKQGNKVLPITHVSAVRDGSGNTLDSLLSSKQDELIFNTAPSSSNKVATMADMPTTMGASGSSHAGGLVPDTPSTAGTTKYLREDGTWAVPSYDGNTTYSLSVGSGGDANKIVLTPSSGTADKITVPYATNAGTVNGKTVGANVPSDAVFTDTTYGVFGSSSNGLTPSTASGNQATAESTSTKKYLCDDGMWRPLPSGAFANGTVTSLSGYATETWVGQQGFLTSKDTPVYTVNNPSGTQTLPTNSHHVFTNVGSTLTIAFGQAISDKSNIYSFEFTTGSTAPTLSLPSTVYMEDYSTLDANTHYEISVKYNAAEQVYYGVIQKWDVSAN